MASLVDLRKRLWCHRGTGSGRPTVRTFSPALRFVRRASRIVGAREEHVDAISWAPRHAARHPGRSRGADFGSGLRLARVGNRVAFTWQIPSGQQIVSTWNAASSQSGQTETAVSESYNGAIAPAASTSFGLQGSGSATTPVLTCTAR
jgi:hypothetical protein